MYALVSLEVSSPVAAAKETLYCDRTNERNWESVLGLVKDCLNLSQDDIDGIGTDNTIPNQLKLTLHN